MALCLVLYSALAAINLLGALVTIVDKKRAETHPGRRRRISHNTFRLLALLGAAPGLLATMHVVRHKTRKPALLAALALLGLIGLAAWTFLLWNLDCLPL